MASPFPGMDPYLEGSEWSSFHTEFCVEIARQLRPKIRPRYTALTTKYFVTDSGDGLTISTLPDLHKRIAPDIGVVEDVTWLPFRTSETIAVKAPSFLAATVMPELVPQHAIEIRDVAEHKLVTVIEILSPANKRGQGYDEYLLKRQRILSTSTHLLEIDLLRKGKRVPMRQSLPNSPYFVFLSRYENRPLTEIWQIELKEPLPIVPVPLLMGDKDAALDLQVAFMAVYDSIEYDQMLDYAEPPDVPLTDEQAEWTTQLLQSRKFT